MPQEQLQLYASGRSKHLPHDLCVVLKAMQFLVHLPVYKVITEASAEHCVQKTGRAHLVLMMMMTRAAMKIQASPLCYRLLRTQPLSPLISF